MADDEKGRNEPTKKYNNNKNKWKMCAKRMQMWKMISILRIGRKRKKKRIEGGKGENVDK
jgi:hypothetical protein